jgi:alkaline phosphatase
LDHPDASSLAFEDASADLAALHVKAAPVHEIFSTREVPGITSDKLEGLVILSPTEIALSNDNDFGIGDNLTGDPSRIWLVRLSQPLPWFTPK